MAENSNSEVRARHIDTRNHVVHDHIKDGLIKILLANQASMTLIL
jgi:hypothetical protein